LIWPNWSGKTNFLNIINQLFRVGLIKEFVYDKEILESWKTNKLENVITQQEVKTKEFI
jgi:ABC-type branched-subunit amino acid transport system ATPase component